jgi:hypothetical protein
MTGLGYWRQVLSPYAQAGYRHGTLDDDAVVLVNEAGTEAHIPRPSAGWFPASLVVPALEPDDHDPEELRGIRYVMQRGRERQELSV